jgi:hypothetical protein
MRCTKVVFPEPAIPIVIITLGFLFDDEELALASVEELDVEAIVVAGDDVAARSQTETRA